MKSDSEMKMRIVISAHYNRFCLFLCLALTRPLLVHSLQSSAWSSNSFLRHSRGRLSSTTLARFTAPSLLLSSSSSSSSPSLSQSLEDKEQDVSTAWKNDLTLHDLQGLLATAQEAARAAGSVIRSHLGCCSEQAQECEIKYSIKDIVTEYDQQAQRAVESIVRSKYPAHGFLGEEDVDPGAAASQAALEQQLQQARSPFLWICDPIDVSVFQG
jgi:Inositol monophosphatase family